MTWYTADQARSDARPADYIVALEHGVWLNNIMQGDPGQSLHYASAQRYKTMADAERALRNARKHRPFKQAEICVA